MRLAVYDLDGTILEGDSHALLLAELVMRSPARWEARARIVHGGMRWLLRLIDDDATKELAAQALAGIAADELREWTARFVDQRVVPRVRPEMRERLRLDREAGFTTLLLSASLQPTVDLVARALGFDHVAATRLALKDGVATGRLEGEPLQGPAKARYLRRFAREQGADLYLARGYGDRASDGAFLEMLGEPFATFPDRALRKVARTRGWSIID